ncbi:MAG: TrkA family potassium uptake protein [Bacilli bacterium]
MKIQKSTIEYGIIGLGRFGYSLALSLSKAGKEVMVLDKDENKIRQIKYSVDEAFIVKSLDKEILEETGIQNCNTVIVGISKEIDISILTTLNIIKMGVPRVIAKATSDEHGSVLEKIGAEVIYPECDMALRLANKLISSRSLDFLKLNGDIIIAEFNVPKIFINKSINESNLRNEFSLNIIAIENSNGTCTEIDPKYVFKEEDAFVVVGSNKNISKFENLIKKS